MIDDHIRVAPAADELRARTQALHAEMNAGLAGVQPRSQPAGAGEIPFPPQVLRAAAASLRAFAASPAGREILDLAAGRRRVDAGADLASEADALMQQLSERLSEALRSQDFSGLWGELASRQPPLESEDAIVHGVSLGVGVSVALGIVLQGSIGLAVDPRQLGNVQEDVVYLSGSIDLGGIGADVEGLVLGLWRVPPTSLAGASLNVTATVDVGVGVTMEASFVRGDWGERFIGVSIGVGEGGEVELAMGMSNTWIWGWKGAPRVYQPRADNYMMIQSIQCKATGGLPGADDMYFTFTVDGGVTYRYPTHGQLAMSPQDTWYAGRSIYFNEKVEVRLYDEDDGAGGADDPRGSITYTPTSFEYSKTIGDNGGSYTITAALNPQPLVWTAAARINTADTTTTAPAMAVFDNRLYCFWRSYDSSGRIYLSDSADGAAWPAANGRIINSVDNTPAGPSAIAFGGQLFVFWRGGNNGVYWSASDTGAGGSWPNGRRIGDGSFTTGATPMPCVFGGTLYLFWNSTGGGNTGSRIVFSAYNAASQGWSAPAIINDRDGSANRVAPCVFDNKLYLFWRNSGSGGDAGQIFRTSATEATTYGWPWAGTINAGETTKAGPAVNVAGATRQAQDQLFVYFITNDSFGNVIWSASATGSSWPQNTPVAQGSVATQTEFGTAQFRDSQYLVWKGSDNGIYFCRTR